MARQPTSRYDNQHIQYRGGNDPKNPSTLAPQLRTFVILNEVLKEEAWKQIFTQLASGSKIQPANTGKELKLQGFVPLLDDANINDQGINAEGVIIKNGNLYGSSKDVGKFTKSLPAMTELGGRINRVGYSRTTITSRLFEFGFFYEYSTDALYIDTMADLKANFTREALIGAHQICEDFTGFLLLHSAVTFHYAGIATTMEEMSGEAVIPSFLTYNSTQTIKNVLFDLRFPQQTTLNKGTTLIDTVTIPGGYNVICGNEIIKTLETIRDPFDEKAWIPVEKYTAGTQTAYGEVGSINGLRIIVNPNMLKYEAKGAAVTQNINGCYTAYDEGGVKRYTVFPMLIVGSDAFFHVGFKASGIKGAKQKVQLKIGESVPSVTRDDPFAKTGILSINWWQGILVQKPKHIMVIYTLAKM